MKKTLNTLLTSTNLKYFFFIRSDLPKNHEDYSKEKKLKQKKNYEIMIMSQLKFIIVFYTEKTNDQYISIITDRPDMIKLYYRLKQFHKNIFDH